MCSNLQRLVKDLYRMLDEINSEDVPVDLKVAESFDDFIWDTKNNDYDLKSFAMRLKATVRIDASVLPFLKHYISFGFLP
jgi:hypothetical protein